MKHLKPFNELYSDTYLSAAQKHRERMPERIKEEDDEVYNDMMFSYKQAKLREEGVNPTSKTSLISLCKKKYRELSTKKS